MYLCRKDLGVYVVSEEAKEKPNKFPHEVAYDVEAATEVMGWYQV